MGATAIVSPTFQPVASVTVIVVSPDLAETAKRGAVAVGGTPRRMKEPVLTITLLPTSIVLSIRN